jgi:tetratricopeptide (TPR) repeat protein
MVYTRLDLYEQAIRCYQRCLELQRETGDELGAASTVNNLGEAYARLGALDQAIVLQREGLKRSRTLRPGACSATSRSSTWPP